jgi:biopolymer transport protein TolR
MAASIQRRPKRGGAANYRKSSHTPMSEINVTPFVDVMLVLLVIFMVTAPLLTVGVEVNLPKTKASSISGSDEPLAITVKADGTVFLQDTEVDLKTLVPRLNAISGANPDARIFIRGDEATNYGHVMVVMGTINAAGYSKVALITAAPKPEEN